MATVSVFIGAGIEYCSWKVYNANGYSIASGTTYAEGTISRSYDNSQCYLYLSPVLKENYSNAVFHRSDGYNQTIAYDPYIYFTADKSGTLSATYNPPATYTLSYDGNGATGGSTTSQSGSTRYAVKYCGFYRTGYDFDYWYTATNRIYYPNNTITLSSNTTLYAHWSKKTYTISYDANGGSGAPDAQTKTHGTDLTLSSKTPTRTGYDFVNWFDGTDYYNPGQTYTANSPASLIAQWKKTTYRVTYNGNHATGGSTAAQTGSETYTVRECGFYKNGYYFKEWQTGEGIVYKPGSSITPSGDITLYAQWKAKSYFYWHGSDANDNSYFAVGKRIDQAVTATAWANLCSFINDIRGDLGMTIILFNLPSAGDPISANKFNIVRNSITQIMEKGYGSITPPTVSSGSEIKTAYFNGSNGLKAAINSVVDALQ